MSPIKNSHFDSTYGEVKVTPTKKGVVMEYKNAHYKNTTVKKYSAMKHEDKTFVSLSPSKSVHVKSPSPQARQ